MVCAELFRYDAVTSFARVRIRTLMLRFAKEY